MTDIEVLLATHAHWDHVAAMSEMKTLTGARLLMHEGDAPLLEDGGRSDFRFGGPEPSFEPVKVDQRLKDGDVVRLGATAITVHHHPGHTKGASSFALTVRDGRDYRVVIANMASINPGVSMRGMPGYANIAADYAGTFRAQKALALDVFLASHASQFGLHRKHRPGDAYDPRRFVDPQGFRAAVERLEKVYVDQLN
jgi:metallo-beta-lactamase class B